LLFLGLAIALLALVVAAAFSPVVQTWAAQRALAQRAGGRATLDSFSAGLGGVEIDDLHLEFDGGVLTLPVARADLPVVSAAREGKLPLRSLVAKGWTLDLSRAVAPNGAQTPAVSATEDGKTEPTPRVETVAAQAAAGVFRGILSGWGFPCDVSLDGVDLEGDVLVAVPPGTLPTQIHVIVKGGGMAAGHEGVFTVDATVMDARLPGDSANVRGHLAVTMNSPRTIDRVGFQAEFLVKSGSKAGNLAGALEATVARGAEGEAYTLDLSRGGRHVAAVRAQLSATTRRLEGTWKLDVRDADVALFTPDGPRPALAAAGEGRFDAKPGFGRVHAVGRVAGRANQLAFVAPDFAKVGDTILAVDFDLTHGGRTLRVERLDASLGGVRPVAVVRSLQPFEIDERSGEMKISDGRGDWLEGSLHDFPLTWFAGPIAPFDFAAGTTSGEFVVHAADGDFVLRAKAPWTASGVAVENAGRTLGRALDLSFSPRARHGREGWQVQFSALTVESDGRRLATGEATVSRGAGADEEIKWAGTWSADLAMLAAHPAFMEHHWLTARSASGEFAGSVGASTEWHGKLAVAGHDPSHACAATFSAEVQADGSIAFVAPLKISVGPKESDLSVEGTWAGGSTGHRVEVTLKSGDIALDHLRWLAGPLAAIGGVPLTASTAARNDVAPAHAGARDRMPFWGDWVGHVRVEFERARSGEREFEDVGGTLKLDHDSILVEGGHGKLGQQRWEELNGALTFEDAAEHPYRFKATVAPFEVDAASVFGAPKPDKEPAFEGRFTVASSLAGEGGNLAELIGGMREEFRLTSASGIIRMLKTHVEEALPPPPPSPVSDALDNVGTAFVKLLGSKSKSLGSGEITLSPNTEAVLNFDNTIAEIGYDSLVVTGVRTADGTIRVVELAMTAADEHLTGSGEIGYAKGIALSARPLSLDVQFGVRGSIADLLKKVGLLSAQKDALGYTLIDQPIHLGGTLEQLKQDAWRAALVEAATRKPVAAKKGG